MSLFSEEINSLQAKLGALSIVVESISAKIAELSVYRDILGTETFEHLLNWQASLNTQIKEVKAQLEDYYRKIEEVRSLLLGY